jgi:hypothetical protein
MFEASMQSLCTLRDRVCEESFIGAAAIRYARPTSPASGQRSSLAVSRESKVSFTPIAAAMQNAGMLAIM